MRAVVDEMCLMSPRFGLAARCRPQQEAPVGGALVVGVNDAPPFAIEGHDGWDGLAIHLWRDATQELDLAYDWQPSAPYSVAAGLMSGTADVATTEGEQEPLLCRFVRSAF